MDKYYSKPSNYSYPGSFLDESKLTKFVHTTYTLDQAHSFGNKYKKLHLQDCIIVVPENLSVYSIDFEDCILERCDFAFYSQVTNIEFFNCIVANSRVTKDYQGSDVKTRIVIRESLFLSPNLLRSFYEIQGIDSYFNEIRYYSSNKDVFMLRCLIVDLELGSFVNKEEIDNSKPRIRLTKTNFVGAFAWEWLAQYITIQECNFKLAYYFGKMYVLFLYKESYYVSYNQKIVFDMDEFANYLERFGELRIYADDPFSESDLSELQYGKYCVSELFSILDFYKDKKMKYNFFHVKTIIDFHKLRRYKDSLCED